MPFVNIRLVAGQGQAKKDEMARKVADAIHGTTGLPKESVWVVFEEVAAADWYVGERSVEAIRKSKT
ncbi:MAG: 4-oxalocrotonate tautomerase family protein [Alphaproteobacteria bacterium]|nr:4-oxalocrotonate tautomerase family protein [Alphaproteobacteria bacterium]